MSMYNLMYGHNTDAPSLLARLELQRSNIPRYRNCWLTADNEIAVYTRAGGDNRSDYEAEIAALQQHPQYLRDADDDFDETYATFYFEVPTKQ